MSASIRQRLLLALVLSAAGAARARNTLGIYLPSMGSGAQQMQVAQVAAKSLGESLKEDFQPRLFTSYEDFAQACAGGELAVALADGWAAAAQHGLAAVATASSHGRSEGRWKLLARRSEDLVQLVGARVATPMAPSVAAKFVDQSLLQGAPGGRRVFELLPAPDPASALKMLESGQVRAALVPSDVAAGGAHELIESSVVPKVVILMGKGQDASELDRRLRPFGDFDAFSTRMARFNELAAELNGRRADPRKPALAEPKSYRLRLNQWLRPPVPTPPLESLLESLDVHEEI